ncbi:hypothetical protein [Paractinoplanes atraurantiacus]|uniref:Uncharacterized protein n=1 Tax=Paractinoplanes atraurantiacus TaxID=1036182 RepID=A0A285FQD9_9ACTN|nr:hypothetical protein [Actinoplanes atraurantiacus]SNY13054.1 hypothetical protein SAMN05421748_1011060 [Actinoplanes atraurantiacus]
MTAPRPTVAAKAALVAGGSFTSSIALILLLAAVWGLGDRMVLWALVALSTLTAAAMLIAAGRLRP